MKVYREWRISGDTDWLKKIWPTVKRSLDYCIETWDPGHGGLVEEPHHNTYDIEFWGPDGMCTSFYLGALQAAARMGRALSDRQPLYEQLAAKAKQRLESELFNGEYFRQKVEREGFHGPFPLKTGFFNEYSTDTVALFEKEGPKYQYGEGCLSDGVLGAWMALVCGVGEPLDRAKVTAHLCRHPPPQSEGEPGRPSPIPSAPPTPRAMKAGFCFAPGPRAALCRCPSSIPTRSGPASSISAPRT